MSNYKDLPSFGAGEWKTPVATASELPASDNEVGEVRVAQDSSVIYVWDGSTWIANANGDITGPGSSTDNAIVLFDGTGGTDVKNSGILIDASNDLYFNTDNTSDFGSPDGGTTLKRPRDIYYGRRLLSGASIGLSTTTRPWQFRPESTETGARGVYVHASAGNPTLTFGRINGTIAAPTATVSGNQILGITALGYGTSAYRVIVGDLITANATETWTNSAAGTELFFRTVLNAGTSARDVLKLTNDGNVILNSGISALVASNFLFGIDGQGSIGKELTPYPAYTADNRPKNVLVAENLMVGSSPALFTGEPGWAAFGEEIAVAQIGGPTGQGAWLSFVENVVGSTWGWQDDYSINSNYDLVYKKDSTEILRLTETGDIFFPLGGDIGESGANKPANIYSDNSYSEQLVIRTGVTPRMTLDINGLFPTNPNQISLGTSLVPIWRLFAGTVEASSGTINTLSSDNLTVNQGITTEYIKSEATNPATAGIVRLGNNEEVSWRNAANSVNLSLKVDASNILQLGTNTNVTGTLSTTSDVTSGTRFFAGNGGFVFTSENGSGMNLNAPGDVRFKAATVEAIAISSSGLYRTTLSSNVAIQFGDLSFTTSGTGLKIKEGANARMGVSTLVAGTVTVANTSITANTRIFLTKQDSGTPVALGAIRVSARVASTSFTITSDNALDTSDIAWHLIEPA